MTPKSTQSEPKLVQIKDPKHWMKVYHHKLKTGVGGNEDEPDQDPMVPSSRAVMFPGLLSQRSPLLDLKFEPLRLRFAVNAAIIGVTLKSLSFVQSFLSSCCSVLKSLYLSLSSEISNAFVLVLRSQQALLLLDHHFVHHPRGLLLLPTARTEFDLLERFANLFWVGTLASGSKADSVDGCTDMTVESFNKFRFRVYHHKLKTGVGGNEDEPDQDPMVSSSRAVMFPGLLSQRSSLLDLKFEPLRLRFAVNAAIIGVTLKSLNIVFYDIWCFAHVNYLLNVVPRIRIIRKRQNPSKPIEAVPHSNINSFSEDPVLPFTISYNLSVPTTYVEHDRVIGASNHTAHLDMRDAMIYSHDRLSP
ncbi:hypothetical protein M5K25_024357 [Dendrobium thyrsiflorum]|uniref:Uncharacterized protein n=1 Tax=Dendrobium thyrsiflorum TaxID=117978 RepID=A0ABD0U212_DENTH